MSVKPHRVTFVGDTNVGKTSIIWRAIRNEFRDPNATAAPCSLTLTKEFEGNQIDLELIDTSGQEKYAKMNNLYYRGSDVVIIVFALDDLLSFQKVDTYYQDILNTMCEDEFTLYLVGNKYDLATKSTSEKPIISLDLCDEKAKNLNARFFVTSALSGAHINELFDDISQTLFEKYKNICHEVETDNKTVDINNNENGEEKRKCC